MGGLTTIQLKDVSQENIDLQNAKLDELGVAKKFRFYSEQDVIEEYQYYLKGDGVYPEHLFPKDKINSYEDFTRYWSSEALGEIFVPKFGMLRFDCYFGRTSERAMRLLGKWVVENHREIDSVSGSWSTFLERASLSKLSLQIIEEAEFK